MTRRSCVFVTALCFTCTLSIRLPLADTASTGQPSSAEMSATALPSSLDDLYPPKTQRPVYFLAMQNLNAALVGIVVDVTENDSEGASANVESFKKHYRESARLVPEWEAWYPTEPVEELETAVATGDPGPIMAAVAKVGAVCHSCHLNTMVPVQFKYHWPDFATITVEDPVTGNDLDYAGFMQMLNAGLTGMTQDLGQGQPDNARAQLAAFRSRMVELKNSCDACHDSERRYFVDNDIEALLTDMDRALAATVPDRTTVAALSQRIGEESCTGCHRVHMPAAYARSTRR